MNIRAWYVLVLIVQVACFVLPVHAETLTLTASECETLRDMHTSYVEIGNEVKRPSACYGLVHDEHAYFQACMVHALDFTAPCAGASGGPKSPLFYAVGNRNEEAVQFLLEHGANAGEPELLFALRYCDTEAAALPCKRIAASLIAHGADPKSRWTIDKEKGLTEAVISFQTRASATSVVEVLLDAGADPSSPGSGGCTPLDEAGDSPKELIRLLESRGGRHGISCAILRAILVPTIQFLYSRQAH